jgi:cytochrome c oxidase subunit 2
MVLVGLVVGAAVGLVATLIPWLPPSATEEGDKIDLTYWVVTAICIAVFALVAAVSVYSVWKFRAAPDDMDDGKPIHGNTRLEVVWTLIPVILVSGISGISSWALVDIQNAPASARTVDVTAQQFAWSFSYPNANDVSSGQLVLENGTTVVLKMQSKDVIHSFWVPEFRMKQDIVPGITTRVKLTPTKVGTYDLICTELCGLGHALMRAQAVVLSHADYEKWVAEQKGGGQASGGGGGGGGGGASADGKTIFTQSGCSGCHTLADAGSTAQVGPDLDKVLKGKDADFVRTSIVDPNKEIAPGFQPGVMPQDFGTKLSDAELDALVDYLVKATNG